MTTIHVGISHDDQLMIPQLNYIQGLWIFRSADSYSKGSIHIPDLLVLVDFMLHSLFYVKDLTPQWKYSLETTVTALLCRSTCRVTLNKEQLASIRIAIRTIRQFSGQTAATQYAFTLYHFTSLLCSCTSLRGENYFLNN